MSKRTSTKLLPSVEYLRACFDYNPETGELRWKQRPQEHFPDERVWKSWNSQHAGMIAGIVKNHHSGQRRCQLKFNRNHYPAHRVIWKWMTGEDPSSTVDHKDGNGANNRWDNLRIATTIEQNWNKRVSNRSTSGQKGVYPSGMKWRARLRIGAIMQELGTFNTKEEAAAAYETAARRLHGEFYRER